ncbi:MAG: Lon-insertion domain-containing protein [Halothiobacillaceae bacterium]
MSERLAADALYQSADFGDLAFASTDELEDFEGLLGQPRAVQAIEVAFGVRQPGFNLYAMGRGGLGKHNALRGTMRDKAAEAPPARDWCYVQNFDDPQRPRALPLPAGMAIRLRADLDQLIQDLLTVVPRSFASGEYPQEKQRIEESFAQRRKLALVSLGEVAEQDGIVILDTPTGYTLAPLADGKPMPQEVFNQLPEDEKKRLDELLEKHRKALLSLLREDLPIWYKETLEQLRELKEKTIGAAIERLIATLVRREGLRPVSRDALGRLIEQASRDAGDAHRLSLHMRSILDLLREANFYAEEDGTAASDRAQVERAIAARIFRGDRYREEVLRAIRKDELRLVVEGGAVGQVNGLSVVELGEILIGRPSRITATVRLGEGDVIDIEREVELGGAIHSKGVMILGSFLGERYARTTPLSIRASLAFEQSYGPVEGDSASVAELCALLSALARLPLSQALAVTGSVNQHGEVQAVGGINEKIEGFFDVCQVLGPRPEQGVIIPRSNVHHLMLRADVVAAVREGRFTIHAADTVDEVMTLLTGLPAGEADAAGRFPPDTVNGRIQAGLEQFVDVQKRFAREMHSEPAPKEQDDG